MATVSFRMDDATKKKFERLCDDLGMSMSTAFNVFAKKAVQEYGMPFEVKTDPFYSEGNLRAIDASIAQLDQGRGVTKTLEELERMENE